ncbi:MAG TPA: TetR/AcrR family transcriptional regulator, partial [Blastocatellia bacterium]|nr:TetR/AcrR family transcriptional regulator [Blastocatellia bacterium]
MGMKISAQQKAQVRVAIERSAERLFRKHGFAAATTRQIATAAGVATGTVFNYFPTKDHLGLSLLRGALEAGNQDFELHRRGDESLAEELFAYMWACLKRLKRDRAFAGEVLQRVGTFGATPTGGRGTGANGEVPKSRSSKPGDDSVISTNGQDVG